MTLPAGLCESWTPVWTCAIPTGSYAVTGVAAEAATEVLHALSGRQFGLCTVTLRPCRRECYGVSWPSGWVEYDRTYPNPQLVAGRWYNLGCSGCETDCSCSVISEAVLPGPVYDITEVKVNGAVLMPDVDYRLDDWRLLVRLNDTWPTCNDLNLADTEEGTWSVTFRAGRPVPSLGQIAHGVLTAEFAKLLTCDATCALPQRVQSISRQGVDITLIDADRFFENSLTGLYWPDKFIQTYNPNGLRQPSRIYDIDNPSRIRQLGTG